MNILKDKRLRLCADMVKGRSAADIGTDHGLVPAYLVTEGICDRCIAADINEGPLEQARKTAAEYGCGDKIDIILSDGLKEIELEGISDIIIAGMGGELIADILDKSEEVRQKRPNLILQPMTRPEVLREYLYDNGFEIISEQCVKEGRFIYSVINAVFTGNKPKYSKDTRYIHFGLIDLEDKMGALYAADRAGKLQKAANGMLKSDRDREEGEKKLAQANELLQLISTR